MDYLIVLQVVIWVSLAIVAATQLAPSRSLHHEVSRRGGQPMDYSGGW